MSDELIRENARLKEENKRRRIANNELTQQLEKIRGEYEGKIVELTASHEKTLAEMNTEYEEFAQKFVEVETERDDYKAKYEAAPEELGQKALELEAKLLERDHRDAFREHIYGHPLDEDGQLKIRDDIPVEDLWSALGYKPAPGVKPDPAALKQLMLQAHEKGKKYLFADGPVPSNGSTNGASPGQRGNAPPMPPGPGAARGQTPRIPEGAFTMTRAQQRDPKFTTRNQDSIFKAAKEGKLVVTDE